jgi:hypothetical protein
MGLFFHEQDSKYDLYGSWNWKEDSERNRQTQIRGMFNEKTPNGVVEKIELEADDEVLFFKEKEKVKALDLYLTVL